MKILICILFILEGLCSIGQSRPRKKFPTAIELLRRLNTYHTDNIDGVYPFEFIPSNGAVTDSVKQKLLAVLKRQWTPEEIKPKVEKYFRKNFEYENLDYIIGKAFTISRQIYVDRFSYNYDLSQIDTTKNLSRFYKLLYDSVYTFFYDSLALAYKKNIEIQIKESSVPDEIVLSIGAARLYDAIPILKADLTNKEKHYFNPIAVEIALAGLGDTTCLREVFQEHKVRVSQNEWYYDGMIYDDIQTMIFVLRTQKSIESMVDWMDTSHNHRRDAGEFLTNDTLYDAAYIIPVLYCLLKNKDFKDTLKQKGNGNIGGNTTREQILFVRKWLIENKGKYEFD